MRKKYIVNTILIVSVLALFFVVRLIIPTLLDKLGFTYIYEKHANLASIMALIVTAIIILVVGFNTWRIKWGDEENRLLLSSRTTGGTTKIDNEIIDDFHLSWKEKIVYITLLRFSHREEDTSEPDKTNRLICTLSAEKIAEYTEIWPWVVGYLLGRLEKKGYVRRSFATGRVRGFALNEPLWFEKGTILGCYEIISKDERHYRLTERRMSKQSDDELLRIVNVDFAKYRNEAVEIAKKELKKRNIKGIDTTGSGEPG